MLKRAVITGPTGTVGVALIQCLIRAGVEVLAVCRRKSQRIGAIPVHPLVRIVELNLNELPKLPEMADRTYDVFYHLGWDGTYGEARNHAAFQLRNIEYTLQAVEAAKKMGCHRFIGAGSQAEYGRTQEKLNQRTPVFPETGYGMAKLCAGQMSRLLCGQLGIEHIWTRILSVYGPGAGTIIMTVIRKLLDRETPEVTPGEQIWDYLYVADAGRALYLLGEKGVSGKTYCIGSGQGRRLKDYIEQIKNEIDPCAEIGYGRIPYSENQVMYLCADTSELTADTGFTPEYSFSEGIRETIQWVRETEGRDKPMSEKYYEKMTEIYKRLLDEESKILFEARISYLLNGDQDVYMDTIHQLYHDWKKSPELEEKLSEVKPKGIIIFGCGHGGRGIKKILDFWKYNVSYFCDNRKHGEEFEGLRTLSVEEVAREHKDDLVIISSFMYCEEMYEQLVKLGFPADHILLSKNRMLVAARGEQYFDVFPPEEEEVFVDAGSFDGQTIIDFCRWTEGRHKKIYAFEPMVDMYKKITCTLEEKNIQNAEIFNCAAWNGRETIYFEENSSSSCVNNDGGIAVQGLDIDSAVKDDKVTFIKMDIEGSELKALEGARNTIIKNKPRLAICIYHKPMDVIELASYILELVPEYKFYIRHYTSHMWETVLYAVI